MFKSWKNILYQVGELMKNLYQNIYETNSVGNLIFKIEEVSKKIELIYINDFFINMLGLEKTFTINDIFNLLNLNFKKLKNENFEYVVLLENTDKKFKVRVQYEKNGYINIFLEEINKSYFPSDNVFRKILETTREIAIVLNNNKIIFFNESLKKATYFNENELYGKEIEELIFKEDCEKIFEEYSNLERNFVLPFQFRMMDKMGNLIWFEISTSDIYWQDKECVLCLLTNVTARRNFQNALFESESRKRILIESMKDLIFVLDNNFRFIEFHTPEDQKLLFKPEYFLKKSINDINFPEPALSQIIKGLKKVKESKLPEQIEYNLFLNGKIHWFDVIITYIDGNDFVKPEFLCVIRDVSKLKEAEEEIKIEHDLFSEGPVMTMIFDLHNDLNIKRVSKNIKEILGYEDKNLVGKSIKNYIYSNDFIRIDKEFYENIRNKKLSFSLLFRAKNIFGEYIWFYTFIKVIKDMNEKISEVRSYSFNKYQIEDIEYQLVKEHEKLENLMEGANVGTWEWDIEKNKIRCNKKWNEIFGYSDLISNAITLNSWEVIIHPDDIHKHYYLIKTSNEKKSKHYEGEYRIKNNEGKWIWVLSRGKVLKWDENGNPLLVSGIHLDINKQKLRELKIINKTKKDLLTDVFNREYTLNKLENLISNKKVFSFAIIDIDFFKKINDNYGHLAGDYILKEFCEFFKKYLSKDSVFGRYGGEEFILVLPKFTKEETYKLLFLILKNMNNYKFKFKNKLIGLTFSAGIVDNESGIETLDFLIENADKKLYQAKQNGRNRINL